MTRLAISVEGQTENEFFKRVLAPHLRNFQIHATPIIVTTKRVLDGPNHKGGDISIDRVVNEIRPLLHSFDFVTTYYDFYAFKGRAKEDTPISLAAAINKALGSPARLFPYVQQYEFESLLLADCEVIGQQFGSDQLFKELERAVAEKGGAEMVNDGYHTCPSRRIETACKTQAQARYDKRFHGPAIAEKIGLEKIRTACPLFAGWLNKLETLGKQA